MKRRKHGNMGHSIRAVMRERYRKRKTFENGWKLSICILENLEWKTISERNCLSYFHIFTNSMCSVVQCCWCNDHRNYCIYSIFASWVFFSLSFSSSFPFSFSVLVGPILLSLFYKCCSQVGAVSLKLNCSIYFVIITEMDCFLLQASE